MINLLFASNGWHRFFSNTGTWVHIDGATSPQFDSNGYVTGLDNDGSFLTDFKRYLDDALERNILIFPTLWNGAYVDATLAQ